MSDVQIRQRPVLGFSKMPQLRENKMSGKILNFTDIKEILPYRPPILMIDRAKIENESKCQGLKVISVNDPVFQGHFPGHPIMPGVLQVEAMQQTATLLLKTKLDPAGTRDIYLKKLTKVKFRKPAFPGDRLLIDITVDSLADGEARITAVNSTRAGVTCQAVMTISVRDRQQKTAFPAEFNDVDKGETTVMDTLQIQKIIPHRFPFLLVDYIAAVDGPNVVAMKNFTGSEPFCHGYTPEYATMPGSLQAEIIAQTGCVHTLMRPENKGRIVYFMSISDMEYYAPIVPGDQLKVSVVVPEGGSKFGKGSGVISVDGEVVSKGDIAFALVDE